MTLYNDFYLTPGGLELLLIFCRCKICWLRTMNTKKRMQNNSTISVINLKGDYLCVVVSNSANQLTQWSSFDWNNNQLMEACVRSQLMASIFLNLIFAAIRFYDINTKVCCVKLWQTLYPQKEQCLKRTGFPLTSLLF